MRHETGHIDPDSLAPDVIAYRAGDAAAGDRLCRALQPVVRLDAARMLGDHDADVDDVVQDALVVCLRYLRAEQGFAGDPVRLGVTIARNRCRDLLRRRARRPHVALEPFEVWLADPARSPLDDVDTGQRRELLQGALDRISADCRALLHALYVEGRTPEQLRVRLGLRTVQGVYYRRGACLASVRKFFQRRLRFGSRGGTSPGADHDRRTGDSAS